MHAITSILQGTLQTKMYVVASMSRVWWFFWWLSQGQIWPWICCQRRESISFVMCTGVASKIARHSVYAARNALQGIIRETVYYVCVCMYVCNVCSQYINIHTDTHGYFESLYKNIMYVCKNE